MRPDAIHPRLPRSCDKLAFHIWKPMRSFRLECKDRFEGRSPRQFQDFLEPQGSEAKELLRARSGNDRLTIHRYPTAGFAKCEGIDAIALTFRKDLMNIRCPREGIVV